MTYELLSNRNLSEGMQVVFLYVNDITGGIFIKMFVFALWMILSLGIYFSQKSSTGMGDLPVAISVSSFITAIICVLMRLIPGLIDLTTITIVIVVFVVSMLWLFFSQD